LLTKSELVYLHFALYLLTRFRRRGREWGEGRRIEARNNAEIMQRVGKVTVESTPFDSTMAFGYGRYEMCKRQ
jgi:hypothetical protein